jgi:hypothetical protein
MPIFDDVDVGRASVSAGPGYGAPAAGGQDVSVSRSQTIDIMAPANIGGQNANTKAAAKLIAVQLAEMVDSVRFVQWESGAGVLVPSPFDGWWHIDSVEPLDFIWSTHVSVRVSATLVEADSQRLAYRYQGGALATNYSGAAIPLIPYPVGSTALVGPTGTRVTADGTIPYTYSPLGGVTRLPYAPSATIANRFLGGVKVYDSMSAGGNAPPASGAAHANWVQVYGPNHAFTGDMIVTNGALLLIFALGNTRLLRAYVWSTGLATAAWQQVADLQYFDNAAGVGTLRAFDLVWASSDVARVVCEASTANGHASETTIYLRRGFYAGRADFRPLTQSNTNGAALQWTFATAIKIAYSSGVISDPATSVVSLGVQTDYGYSAGFTANTAQPFISGLLNLNRPSAAPAHSTALITIGDTGGPAQGAVGIYGFFAIPFGTSGSYSTANLQGEMESGTLAGGWVSAADAAASAGNAAKLPTGTAAGSTVVGPGIFTPVAGTYIWAVRIRNSGLPTNASEMNVYATVAGSAGVQLRTFGSGNGSIASYTWFFSPAAFALSGAQSVRIEASNATIQAATKDWFVDEFAILPITLGRNSPQELWQEFLYEYDLVDA